MKRRLTLYFALALALCLSACGTAPAAPFRPTGAASPSPTPTKKPAAQDSAAEMQPSTRPPEDRTLWLKLTAGEGEVSIALNDSAEAAALYDLLPLELEFEDYNHTEKIAYLPEGQELPSGGAGEYDPEAGDLCLYAPWGNLCIFYRDFGPSRGLIPLGHLKQELETIAGWGDSFSATLERAEEDIGASAPQRAEEETE